MNRFFAATIAFCFVASVAFADEKPTDAEKKITFEDHIKPIFRQHCASCHNAGEKKGGLALDSFNAVMEGGGSGEIVYDDGDADGSRLWQLVNHDDTPIMPPNQDKIPAEQLALLRGWIEGGILENSGSKAKAKKKSALTFVASTGGKPEGPVSMPVSVPQVSPVVTSRAAATTAIAASPWAPLIAVAGQKQIVLYHSDTSELLGILPFEEGIAQSLRFSRDGSYLIAGGGEHSFKGVAAIYDVKTGERAATIGDELDVVFDADVNSRMTQVAMGGPQKMLRIFNVADGEKLFDIKKHTDWILAVAYSPDGVLIASGDRSSGLCLWEADTGRLYLELAGHKGAINAVAWRDDSNVVASASDDGTVKIWEVADGKAIKTISVGGGGVTDVAFDHQGRLVTASKDNTVKLWDANGGSIRKFQPMQEDVLEVAVSHDGKRVVYGDWAGEIFNASTEKPEEKQILVANPPGPEQRIKQVQQTIDGIQKEFSPAKAAYEKAVASAAAAKKPIDDLNAKIAALKAESGKATAAVELAKKRVADIDAKLPGLVTQNRSQHDQVIAARLALGNDASKYDTAKMDAVANTEQQLADQLVNLASLRKQRSVAHQSISAHQANANSKKAEADKLAAGLPAMQKTVAAAEKSANDLKVKLDAITGRLTQAKDKLSKLTAAVN